MCGLYAFKKKCVHYFIAGVMPFWFQQIVSYLAYVSPLGAVELEWGFLGVLNAIVIQEV
jgi:hypothetical protein